MTERINQRLNDIMEFDHVIRVDEIGRVFDGPDNIHAPGLMDDELDSDQWEFFSHGYTGQYGYNGPVMHNSEYIGGKLARDILTTPGIYAAVVADWSPDESEGQTWDDDRYEGWAVVKLKD